MFMLYFRPDVALRLLTHTHTYIHTHTHNTHTHAHTHNARAAAKLATVLAVRPRDRVANPKVICFILAVFLGRRAWTQAEPLVDCNVMARWVILSASRVQVLACLAVASLRHVD